MGLVGDDVLVPHCLGGVQPEESAGDRRYEVIEHVAARKLVPFAEVVIDALCQLPVGNGSRDWALIGSELDIRKVGAGRDGEELRVRVSSRSHLLQQVRSGVDT